MTWQVWKQTNDRLLHSLAQSYGGVWYEDLYQELLLKSWLAYERYGSLFAAKISRVLRNSCYDFLKWRKKKNSPLTVLSDAPSVSNYIILECLPFNEITTLQREEWERIFAVAHRTANLDAARIMRSVVNPDLDLLVIEEARGGFSLRLTAEYLNIDQKRMRSSLSALRKSIGERLPESFVYTEAS
jgi:DNA-directed RNA polymerase specialized sigma24 family protein